MRVEFDVNKDGYPDLCASVSTGSGIISSLIAVYDVHNDVGYMLHDRGEYDYVFPLEDRMFMVVHNGSMTGQGADYIFSVADGEAYELDISGLCYLLFDEESKTLSGEVRGDWSPTVMNYLFEYNSDDGQFKVAAQVEEFLVPPEEY